MSARRIRFGTSESDIRSSAITWTVTLGGEPTCSILFLHSRLRPRTTGHCDEHSLLNLDKTLDENGILDERERFFELRMPVKPEYTPMLTLHYNDDMEADEEEFEALYGDVIAKG